MAAADSKSIEVRPANHDGGGAAGESLEDIDATAHAAIQQDRDLAY